MELIFILITFVIIVALATIYITYLLLLPFRYITNMFSVLISIHDKRKNSIH